MSYQRLEFGTPPPLTHAFCGTRVYARIMRTLRITILSLFTLLFGVGVAFAQSPDRELRAQILNVAGQPVKDAKIIVRAVSRASGTRYGDTEDVEGSATSDAKGEFVIHGRNPFLAATVTAEAPGYAKAVFSELATGGTVHPITMFEGVSVVGAVLKDRRPVAGVKIGLCDTDRNSRIFTIDLAAMTDAEGHFRIANVPPKRDYYLFGYMHSFADKGALTSRRIRALADGSILDLGELNVEPACVLEGHLSIQLPHIPILLSRYHGRDAQTTDSGALGQFHFAGVPGELMTVSVDAPGYRLTLHDASLNPSDPTHLLGRVLTNKTDFLIEIETGPALDPINISTTAAAEEPLRGAEPPSPGPNTIKITGNVLDAESGQQIASLITSEGRVNAHGYDWFFTRAQRHQNGEFTTYLTTGANPPVLVVQSDNHMPWVSGPITAPTNFNIKLARALQPQGVVLKPDGQPATNVAVYLANGYGNTRIENFGVENSAQRAFTDARGHFEFPPQNGAVAVMVFDDAGFSETPLNELMQTGKVRLKPLAKVEGKLLIGAAPGTNEIVYLSTAPAPYHWYPLELPAYTITFTTRTDAKGNFAFDRVPPTLMEIAHSPNVAIVTASGAALPTSGPAGAFRLTQTQRILTASGETSHVTLGGKGRAVIGRVEIAGSPTDADWRGSPQAMELIVPHEGPSDAAMKSLLEKLRDTAKPSATEAQRKAAEQAYETERRSFALATQKYFATDQGMAALLASHRYFMLFDSEGAFRIDDVPPGNYRITGMISSADPSALSFARRFVGEIDAEIKIPEGNGPFDLGVIKAEPIKPTK
jgi:hypothetical protein